MMAVAFVAVAAVFTLVRAVVTAGQPAGEIPWRTLAVNTIGSFLLGLIVTAQWWSDPVIAAAAGLGSLTTFSTVAAETSALLNDGRKPRAIAYVGLSVVVGVAAAWLGLSIGDSL